MNGKRVIVVGAGPGGLTAAMILASRGYRVDVFEKQPFVGGRNGSFTLDGGFTFDLGPTFLMMPFILDEMFTLAGRRTADYLDIRRVDPLYRLGFADGRDFLPTQDHASMRAQMENLFPGSWPAYQRYMAREKVKFERLLPCLQAPYSSWTDLLAPRLAKAVPYLDAHVSLFQLLGRYFSEEELKISFTFQAKYLGMSPWQCPGTFSIISYIEHAGGIHHPIGGLNQISKAMARVLEEEHGRVHLGTGVKEVLVDRGAATGVLLENGEVVRADHVVLGADFGHAMNHLVRREHLTRWTPERLETKGLSCSTFMLYLGVDRVYDIPHHNILFASDYRQNVREIAEDLVLSQEPSIYVQNACKLDPTLAPAGQSTLYVLVPVPNNRAHIDWKAAAPALREKVLDIMERRGGTPDVRKHIVAERVITPEEWEARAFVYRGATFNLAHSIDQMLIFRPHNAFEEFDRCYLVGGGTHPGSGLPTIYESGRIAARMIIERDRF